MAKPLHYLDLAWGHRFVASMIRAQLDATDWPPDKLSTLRAIEAEHLMQAAKVLLEQ